MEIQIVTFVQQNPEEPMPRLMFNVATPLGMSILLLPAMHLEVFRAVRDKLNEEVVRLEAEAATLKAMAQQQPPPGRLN